MTFTLPEEVARRFIHAVPSRRRSQYVAEALDAMLSHRDKDLIAACEIANADPDLQSLESDFDALQGDIAEPWTSDGGTQRPATR